MDLLRKNWAYALAVAAFFAPLYIHNPFWVGNVLVTVCVYVILVAGLDLVVGYNGDVSVGHAGLFAGGAYGAAILMWHLEWPFLAAAPVGIVLAMFFGLLLGMPALRLRGPYLAVATIAFGLIIQTIVNEWISLTLGSQGINLPGKLVILGFEFDGPDYYYLCFVVMVVCLVLVRRVTRSYWGRAFEALKENTLSAECTGISRYKFKLTAFVLSAVFAGVAGALFVNIDRYVGPPTFSTQLSILFLIMLIFGGVKSIYGNIVGSFIVVILNLAFADLYRYQFLIFGGMLIFTLYFLPGGIAGVTRWIGDRFFPGLLRRETTPAGAPQLPVDEAIFSLRESADPAKPVLQTHDLTIRFGGLTAVNQLNMSILRGTVHALIGPNGSGKSTTVNLITGVYKATSGRVTFLGAELSGLPNAISHAGIARTFQNVALFGDMTVLENVLVGVTYNYRGGLVAVLLGLPVVRREEAAARARCLALLDFVGLRALADEKARNLPYGKQRLLEIARALAQSPALILLDEPAAGLTSGEMEEVGRLILKMKERGLTILLIEHHMELVMAISDQITVIDFGQKISEGTPAHVQRDPKVIQAYLGTSAEANGAEAAHA